MTVKYYGEDYKQLSIFAQAKSLKGVVSQISWDPTTKTNTLMVKDVHMLAVPTEEFFYSFNGLKITEKELRHMQHSCEICGGHINKKKIDGCYVTRKDEKLFAECIDCTEYNYASIKRVK